MTSPTLAPRPRRRPAGLAPWQERPSLLASILRWSALGIFAALIAVPLWSVVVTSFAPPLQLSQAGGLVLWPEALTLTSYSDILGSARVPRAFVISVVVTLIGTLANTAVTAMGAYGLSRPNSLLHRPILLVVLITYLFGPGMIPVYMTVQGLGLINNLASLILPNLVAAFNLVILRNFFMSLPEELSESARIDGASDFTIFTRIVLPLSKASLAVVALFYGVGYWNAFFNAMLYLDDTTKFPLQLVLRDIVLNGSTLAPNANVPDHPTSDLGQKMAMVVLATMPVLAVYPFVQRHFVKGVVVGAVKG